MKVCPSCNGLMEYQSVLLGKKKTPANGPIDNLVHAETWTQTCPKNLRGSDKR